MSLRLGRLSVRITPIRLVIAVAFLASSGFIAVVVLKVRDTSQIPMLSSGFAVLGLSLVAMAIWALVELWRAASDGNNLRAMLLGVVGGLIGMAAIGCFTATVLLALLWKAAGS